MGKAWQLSNRNCNIYATSNGFEGRGLFLGDAQEENSGFKSGL